MTRTLAVWLVAGLLAPSAALAQQGLRPAVEVGVDLTAGPGDGEWQSIAPRVSFNFDSRSALEAVYAPQADREGFSTLDYGIVRVKRTLVQTDRGGVFGTLGGALARRTYAPVLTRQSSLLFPPDHSINAAVGLGAERELGAHAAVRAEVEYLIGPQTRLRFGGGLTIPIGRYADRSRADDSLAVSASPAGLVRAGQTVWIVSKDGREWKGEVGDRSLRGLTIRHARGTTAIALDDILTIDGPDSLSDGLINGAIAGGSAGAVLGWIGGQAWCEGDSGCIPFGMLVVGGIGAGIGSRTGAIADSFHERRRPIYDARVPARGLNVAVAPVVARHALGLAGAVNW